MNAFNQPPINHEKNDWHISIEGQNGEWLQKKQKINTKSIKRGYLKLRTGRHQTMT